MVLTRTKEELIRYRLTFILATMFYQERANILRGGKLFAIVLTSCWRNDLHFLISYFTILTQQTRRNLIGCIMFVFSHYYFTFSSINSVGVYILKKTAYVWILLWHGDYFNGFEEVYVFFLLFHYFKENRVPSQLCSWLKHLNQTVAITKWG